MPKVECSSKFNPTRADSTVLRSTERARNIHRLVEIRDAANNMPAVNAINLNP
jgi:hypothetical protein